MQLELPNSCILIRNYIGRFFFTTLFFHTQDNIDSDVSLLQDTGDVNQFIEREEVSLPTEENQDVSDFVALPYEQTGGVFFRYQ